MVESGCAELLDVGMAMPKEFTHAIEASRKKSRAWRHPYGTPKVAERIVDALGKVYDF